MLTYQDFLAVGDDETEIGNFILQLIADHESSDQFKTGQIAGEFYRHNDPYQEKIEKWIYDANGNKILDKYSPNHKLTANWHFVLTTEMVGYLLGNGISFTKPEIKEKLGGSKFDNVLQDCLAYSANDGVSYGLVTEDGVVPLCFACDNTTPYFAGLLDEFDGALKAGVRYWRIAPNKPRIATLYTIDGYMKFRENADEDGSYSGKSGMTLIETGKYKMNSVKNDIQGEYLTESENYSELPIVPLYYINKQSSIKKNAQTLLMYDLTLSGFSNDVVQNLIYWVLTGYDGMDKEDDMRFLRDMYIQKIIHNEEHQTAEPRQIEAQYQAREAMLTRLEHQIIYDYMGADIKSLRNGAVTTVEIESAYTRLEQKCNEVEKQVRKFVQGILRVYGIDENESFHFTRDRTISRQEEINNVLASAQTLGDEYTTKKLLEIFGDIDEFENIQKQKQSEEMAMFNAQSANNDNFETGMQLDDTAETTNLQEAIDSAEDATGKALNGAQMQSLIAVMEKLSDGKLTENQAVNILSTAIGISKDKAKEIIRGDE